MEFGLLGTVIATVDGRILELGRRRERLLLALLLLDVGKPIATDRLIDLLWGQDLPRDPRSAIHVHISRIRRRLAVANSARYGVGVVSVPGGYAIHAESGSVDVHRFVSQVAEARVIADAAARTETLGAALALWRGEALADVAPGWLRQRICPQLEELRLTALELRIEADLELRRHAELIPELAALVREHPARERLIALWMLALYRDGRQQDALAAYARTAKLLAEDFGLDPGSDLRELRTSILRDDPGLTPRESHSPSFSPAGSRSAQLPAEASTFVGRDAELAALLAMLDMRPANPASGPVVTIDGMAGIGKTAFALHAARHLGGRYPDGQMFVDLRGFTEGVEATDPHAALGRILTDLGAVPDKIPASLEARAAQYRDRLANRSMIILLDNAASEAQVRPLIPAGPGSVILITSRLTLAGLDDTLPVHLDVLPLASAALLLSSLVAAADRAEVQGSVTDVVELCGRLPLALRLAASRLRHRQPWTMEYLADRLRESHRRLHELEAGQRSVAAAFDLSYRGLTETQRQLFLLIGLSPCPDMDERAAAAITGNDAYVATRTLEQLVDANLLDEPSPGRYQFHDLVRLYASTTAAAGLRREDRDAAIGRLFTHYLWGIGAAKTIQAPHTRNRRLRQAIADSTFPPFDDRAAAQAWYAAEEANVLAAVVAAGERGMHDVMRTLAEAMFSFLEKGTSLAEGLRVFKYAAAKLHNCGDIEGEITALRCSAILASMLGSSREALEYLRDAHAIVGRSGPPILEASVLINLGETMSNLGSLAEADTHLNHALAIIREAGDQFGEEYCLRMLSPIQWARGDRSAAISSAQQAVDLSQAAGQRDASGFQHLLLAGYRRQLGQYQEALEHLALAADAWEIIGDHTGEILMLVELGAIRSARGEHEDALAVLRDALARARHGHILGAEFEVTLGLSEAYRSAGELDTALRHHWVALDIAEDLGQPRAIIRARDSVAQTLQAMGDLDQATAQWQRVLDDHGATEIIELDDVRARLTRARQPATCPAPAPAPPARDRVPEPPEDSRPQRATGRGSAVRACP